MATLQHPVRLIVDSFFSDGVCLSVCLPACMHACVCACVRVCRLQSKIVDGTNRREETTE